MRFDRKDFVKIILGVLSIFIVLFAPYGYHIHLNPGPNSITAMIWEYSTSYSFRYFSPLGYYIEFYIFRIVVLYYIFRFLLGKTVKKRLIIMSIINEIIPLILSIPGALIVNSEGEYLRPIIISIPILLLFNLFIVYTYPRLVAKYNS
jgi:multisubunit Na+/H+ antiporter MnhF subunit